MLLKEYRKKQALSVIAMAKKLKISRQHVYDIERRKAYPSRALALRIEKATGGLVPAWALLLPNKSEPGRDPQGAEMPPQP